MHEKVKKSLVKKSTKKVVFVDSNSDNKENPLSKVKDNVNESKSSNGNLPELCYIADKLNENGSNIKRDLPLPDSDSNNNDKPLSYWCKNNVLSQKKNVF